MSRPGETPSSVLRETLLEFSRRRRRERYRARRARHEALRSQSLGPTLASPKGPDEELAFGSDGHESDALQDTFLDSLRKHPIKESLALEDKPEETKSTKTTEEVSVEEVDAKQAIYLKRHETDSHDSLVIDDVQGAEWTVACCSSGRFYVPIELKDADKPYQTRFIQKVFLMIFIKTVLISTWIRAVEWVKEFHHFYLQTAHFHFASAGIYVIIKLMVRVTKNFRRRHCCFHFMLHLIELAAISDFIACAGVTWLENYFTVPRKIISTLAGVCLFFIFVGNFVKYDITDGIMVAAGVVVTFVMSVHQILHVKSFVTIATPNSARAYKEIVCAGAVIGASELLIVVIMVELKSIMTGRRFSPAYSDWFFASMYVI